MTKVYFYHTENIQFMFREWRKGSFPGHLLYGATHLERHGIEIIQHKFREFGVKRLPLMLYTAYRILTCSEKYDAIYATHYRGLEIIIFLRALGLYRHPIILWHHQPMVRSSKRWREMLGRLFYKGMDDMFFFSQDLIDESLKTSKAVPERMHLGHWGPDIEYYDKVIASEKDNVTHEGFISTGREMRDMKTLVEAFSATGAPIEIYLNKRNCGIDYEAMFAAMDIRDNAKVHFTSGYKHSEFCLLVYRAQCVCICCLETKYTVGLTTVVEALGLGVPMICSRNPHLPMDIEKEGCGILVDYGDTEGWISAIRYITGNPEKAAEMGRNARNLAQRKFNVEICAREVADIIKKRTLNS